MVGIHYCANKRVPIRVTIKCVVFSKCSKGNPNRISIPRFVMACNKCHVSTDACL